MQRDVEGHPGHPTSGRCPESEGLAGFTPLLSVPRACRGGHWSAHSTPCGLYSAVSREEAHPRSCDCAILLLLTVLVGKRLPDEQRR